VTVPERCARVQDNVHFYVQLITSVIRLQALDLLDGFGEAHSEVQHFGWLVRDAIRGKRGQLTDIPLVSCRRETREMSDMLIARF
jgi:hypothetical protein